MKVCIVCGQEKPLDQFPTNRGMKDGHLGWCFECFAHRHKFYHYPTEVEPQQREERRGRPKRIVLKTPEERKKRRRELAKVRYHRRKEDPAFRECRRESSRKHYWLHRERNLERHRKWVENNLEWAKRYHHDYYLRHKEELAAKRKTYYEANKEKFKEWNRLNYERRKNASKM